MKIDFIYLKSLKFVNSLISSTYSYFRCFLEYSSRPFTFSSKTWSYLADFWTSLTSSQNLLAFINSFKSSDSFSNLSKDNFISLLKIYMYLGIWDSVSLMLICKFVVKVVSSPILSFSSLVRADENAELSTIFSRTFSTANLSFSLWNYSKIRSKLPFFITNS